MQSFDLCICDGCVFYQPPCNEGRPSLTEDKMTIATSSRCDGCGRLANPGDVYYCNDCHADSELLRRQLSALVAQLHDSRSKNWKLVEENARLRECLTPKPPDETPGEPYIHEAKPGDPEPRFLPTGGEDIIQI